MRIVAIAAVLVLVGCGHGYRATPGTIATHQIRGGSILLGPAPGQRDLEDLSRAGVRSVLSVDAATPDADAADALGMRYVHVPLGYDGISPAQQVLLAAAIKHANAPLYVHCHRGRHRAPAAVASALIALGRWTPRQGTMLLAAVGCHRGYEGLWSATRRASPLDAATIDAAARDLPKRAMVEDLAEAMAAIDRSMELLDLVGTAGWRAPASHPDLVPRALAGQLHDQLRAVRDLPALGDGWHGDLDAAIAAVAVLESGKDQDAALAAVQARCTACHQRWRD